MWRNSASFSSKLIASLNRNKTNSFSYPHLQPSLVASNDSHVVGNLFSRSRLYLSTASSVESIKSDPIQTLGASELTPTAFSALSASKVHDVVDLVRHYGRCYYELSKARLSLLVVATSGTGYILGSGSAIDYAGLCFTCAGTMMVAASANSLNQLYEVGNDAKMKRTMRRPLPSSRITKAHAATWASCVGIAGTTLLAYKTNMLAAGLAASNLVLYASVYTPLKQIHPVNTWVGAIVGAVPPLLGWAAAAGEVSLNAMILPAALYFWQIPHFMALAYLCRQDYVDGGFRMYSLADASGQRTAMVALRNCLYLLPLSYLAYDWSITSGWFCLESTILALAISGTALSFYFDRSINSARRMFRASLLYLPVFMSGLLFHRLPEGKQSQAVESTHMVTEPQVNKDYLLEETGHVNKSDEVKTKPNAVKRRPPVAFASAAPFPFLPAPGYAIP